MQGLSIRTAEERDIGDLCHLYYDFHEFHACGVPERLRSLGSWENQDLSDLREAIRKILEDESAGMLVAELEGKVVGLAEVYYRQDQPGKAPVVSHRYAHLQSLMVQEGSRRKGVGEALVQAVETWAVQKGADEVHVETWEFPEGPLPFYEKTGYHIIKSSMVKRLGPD